MQHLFYVYTTQEFTPSGASGAKASLFGQWCKVRRNGRRLKRIWLFRYGHNTAKAISKHISNINGLSQGDTGSIYYSETMDKLQYIIVQLNYMCNKK